jgi:chromate transporter
MLLKLFLTFVKINLLAPSGPASIGLTQKFVVPEMITADKFNEIIAIASGVPGSDAIQIAWQVGFAAHGFLGAIIATLGALTPCISLAIIVSMVFKYISIDVMKSFFKGVMPALAVFLVLTAFNLIPHTFSLFLIGIMLLTVVMLFLKLPISVILVICGLLGILINKI